MVERVKTNAEVLSAEMGHIREGIGEIKSGMSTLRADFAASSTKQGERLGIVEDDVIRLRADLKWMLTVAAGIWAVLQAAVLTLTEWHK